MLSMQLQYDRCVPRHLQRILDILPAPLLATVCEVAHPSGPKCLSGVGPATAV